MSNAGGVNPRACAMAVRAVADRLGLGAKIRIGLVTGDDLMDRLDALGAEGEPFANMDTGRPLRDIRAAVRAANAYLGVAPVVQALAEGANIVITGRVTDTGLTLGPLVHEFGWPADDWDRIAAGTVAGHILECGAQSSGGNLLKNWRRVPDLADVGFPIVEASRRRHLRGHQASRHRRRRQRRVGHRAAGLRDGRPDGVHHPGRHRRLHHHPAAPAGAGPGRRVRHPRPRRGRRS